MSDNPPPPYTPASPTTRTTASSPSSTNPSTPLPSYTTSPVLRPLQPASPTRFKLNSAIATIATAAADTVAGSPTCTASHASPSLITKALVASVAILGPWSADILYLTAVNFLGVLLTLLQLPVVLLLAVQPAPPEEVVGERRPIGRAAAKQRDWARDFTQVMWDWHDRLEEAELELPSRIG